MEPSELLRHVAGVFERLGLPYFVTGSMATIYYGEPRFTNDIDVVVQLPPDRIMELCAAFPEAEFYLSEEAARRAVARQGQFNLIHPASGLKVDIMIPSPTSFNRSRFARTHRLRTGPDEDAAFASPEDVILKKLEYYLAGRSEKHLRDITGVLRVSGERIDRGYITDWAARLGVAEVWDEVLRQVDIFGGRRLSMIIALASPGVATSLDQGLDKVERLLSEASAQGAEIVCFPEAYLPGLRGQDFEVYPFDQAQQEQTLHAVAQWARMYAVAAILGMERITPAGRQIAAFVLDAQGQLQGIQTKNQLDPTEEPFYVPGTTRQLFEVNGLKFGVTICHEGWRYPETVRWAAVRGAKIVFHPQHTGSERDGVRLTEWGAPEAPYYEKAMMCRGLENTIYFASVNYALRFQESATSLIDPSGRCQAYLPYGEEGVLVQAIDLEKATGLLAGRYAPERYEEAG